MANIKTPLIQNCKQGPKYLDEIPLKCNGGEKESTPQPQSSVPNLGNLGRRLRRRKDLINQRQWIVDLEFLFAMAGVILMVINTELYFTYKCLMSLILETAITITTASLVTSVGFYHWTGICLRMLDDGVENWRLACTGWTVSKIIVEVIICSIQPVPYFTNQINGFNSTNASLKTAVTHSSMKQNLNREVPINVILSLMMLCRLYLIGRIAVVHSNILIDSALHSFSALSRVTINVQFVFRALMSTHPAWVLTLIMLITFVCASWAMHTCEKFASNRSDQSTATQAMWVIAVTFLTVGYGDLVPVSTCGRVISIVTGLSGVGIVALWVAVLARKLEQTRPEKYIYSFIRRVRLEQNRKNAAADVMKQAVRLWKLRRNGYLEADPLMIVHRRKFLRAVRVMREAAVMDSQIKESAIGMAELYFSLTELTTLNKESFYFQKDILQRVIVIEKSLHEISSKIEELSKSITNSNRTPEKNT